MVSLPALPGTSAQKLTTRTHHRTGVLCIILCFALGIANIFHFDIIIVWSVLCLFVPTTSSLPPNRSNPLTQNKQHLRLHPNLHRNPPPAARLPDIPAL